MPPTETMKPQNQTQPVHLITKPTRQWAVMRAYAFDSLTVLNGVPLQTPPQGPHFFIPVFNTREQAVAWHNSEDYIAELEATPITKP